jgi:hypothetical protein
MQHLTDMRLNLLVTLPDVHYAAQIPKSHIFRKRVSPHQLLLYRRFAEQPPRFHLVSSVPTVTTARDSMLPSKSVSKMNC